MACGNAVIASDRGDTGLFINSSNGLLIDLNKNSLISAMETLINDPALTSSLAENGRKYVRNEHTIERYSEYFFKMLNKAYNKVFENDVF